MLSRCFTIPQGSCEAAIKNLLTSFHLGTMTSSQGRVLAIVSLGLAGGELGVRGAAGCGVLPVGLGRVVLLHGGGGGVSKNYAARSSPAPPRLDCCLGLIQPSQSAVVSLVERQRLLDRQVGLPNLTEHSLQCGDLKPWSVDLYER